MSLTDEYRRQFEWRDWDRALSLCPINSGQRVLDLGCGPGDLSLELATRGAHVTGVDGNAELIAAAQIRCPQGNFEVQDLNQLNLKPEFYDGLWCSFAAAYFTDLEKTFSRWKRFLKKNSWVCFIEIDDLFGHEPISAQTRTSLDHFYDKAAKGGWHDFRMGKNLHGVLERAGFSVQSILLDDREFSFSGAAHPEILQAWRDRLKRMSGLRTHYGENISSFEQEFLQCLSSNDHRSHCRVMCSVGTR